MSKTIEQLRAALQRHLNRSVHVASREEWLKANHPDGRPVKLAQPLTPFRTIEQTGKVETAVASATPYADVPGFHIVRLDLKDAPDIFNTDSQDVIEDLPGHDAWARVLQISGMEDASELRDLARQYIFLVATRREDHHSSHVPPDIASAEPKAEE